MWPQRKHEEPDPDLIEDEDAQVIPLPGVNYTVAETIDLAEPEILDAELVFPDDGDWHPQSRLAKRATALAERPVVLPVRHVRAAAGVYTRATGRGLLWLLTHPLHPFLYELLPIRRGIVVTFLAWHHWRRESELRDDLNTGKRLDSKSVTTQGKHWSDKVGRHNRLSFLVFMLLIITAWVMWIWWPLYLAAAGIALVVILDIVGRLNPPAGKAPLAGVVRRYNWEEGMSLRHLTSDVVERLREENVRVDPIGCAQIHGSGEYRVDLSHEDEISSKHLRAVERTFGWRPNSVRVIGNGEDAGASQLRIQMRDPLAGAQPAQFHPTGSLSCTDYLPLGRSEGETPCALRFVGTHVAVIGRTRSGKTEGALWTIIDRLSACHDAVIWGIDLQHGPAFPMWRGVIQEVAYTEAEAEALLHMLRDEIDRRMRVLTRLAESDDDDDAGSVWTADLGHYIFLPIDEFALTAAFNGEKGRADLMTLIEDIIRIGLKVGVQVILASQKTGNSDMGSTVISSQISTKILLACYERDTVTLLSTGHRDKGWAPHALQPAQNGADPRDAGVAYIESPVHNTPDRYRFEYWTPGDVKRRARQRLADGLPSLDHGESNVIEDAVEMPEVLAAMKATSERLGHPDFLPTAELVADLGDGWGGRRLAGEVKAWMSPSQQFRADGSPRGYWRKDLDAALRDPDRRRDVSA